MSHAHLPRMACNNIQEQALSFLSPEVTDDITIREVIITYHIITQKLASKGLGTSTGQIYSFQFYYLISDKTQHSVHRPYNITEQLFPKMIEAQVPTASSLQDTTPPLLPSSPQRKAFENFQILQSLGSSSRWQNSKDSLDTECTSDPPDHHDKLSLKLIDDVTQFQPGEQPFPCKERVDFMPLAHTHSLPTMPRSLWQKSETTLRSHFTKTMKIDKYLRLISSAIKTRRAYHPQSSLNPLYKELILARRVIRWESKYDTFMNLLQGEEGMPMKAFKIMQLAGDIVDLSAFWLKIVNKGTQRREALIQRFEQTESNFYFGECLVWLCIYTYRYLKLRKESKENASEEQRRKLNENLLKAVKYCMDVLTSYNNCSFRRIGGEINHKLAGYLTFFSSAIGIFLLWR